MDFGALPPEINSARMYSGPGSGPLLAAVTGWDGLAAELESAATSYGAVISRMTALSWHGPASASMAAAAAPYVAWMNATAAQAEQAASQARAAAAAYEAAFAATVPPPVIAANRSLLLSLIRHEHPGTEHAGDRGHRGPVPADVGPRCRRDVWLRRLVCGRSDVGAVYPAAADHQPGRPGRAGCGRHPNHQYGGRDEHPGGTNPANLYAAHGAAGARLATVVRRDIVAESGVVGRKFRHVDS